MKLTWSEWKTDDSANPNNTKNFLTPYADWYLNVEKNDDSHRRIRPMQQRATASSPPLPFPFVMHDLHLPNTALRPGSTKIVPPAPRENALKGLSVHPSPDDVIIGVIDSGLALAHERFRRKGGVGTRILSYWQQGGDWQNQEHLPFGRELMQAQIDHLMVGDQPLDEAAFNRAAKLVDFSDPQGERWVETAAPHGTHVADLAAGCDPDSSDPQMANFRDRTHLVLVELAPRVSIGTAGNFLEDFAIWAINHIVSTADALWQSLYPKNKAGGFPIVINLSYGFNAGPKAGMSALQKYVRVLNYRRRNGPPVRLVLPAGNDNLDQGSAVLMERSVGTTASLDWRVLPEDRTSSYVEIWVDPEPVSSNSSNAPSPGPIWLTPPAGPIGPGQAGTAGQYCDLTDEAGTTVARIYCRLSDTSVGISELDGKAEQALGYVLCVAPTFRPDGPAAPSGAWRITLGEGPLAKLYVQSDQVLVPGYSPALLSYFENTEETPAEFRYLRYNSDTSIGDSYRRDPITGWIIANDSKGPIRRQNTMNALSGAFGILTIAGYRATDGWPAVYSSTARGLNLGGDAFDARDPSPNWQASSGGKAFMEAAAISDDGIWHGGRLAAGGKSGSASVMQGTSFASAEASRIVTGLLLNWVDDGRPADSNPASSTHFMDIAAEYEAQTPYGTRVIDLKAKLGSGRLPRQNHGRPARVLTPDRAP